MRRRLCCSTTHNTTRMIAGERSGDRRGRQRSLHNAYTTRFICHFISLTLTRADKYCGTSIATLVRQNDWVSLKAKLSLVGN